MSRQFGPRRSTQVPRRFFSSRSMTRSFSPLWSLRFRKKPPNNRNKRAQAAHARTLAPDGDSLAGHEGDRRWNTERWRAIASEPEFVAGKDWLPIAAATGGKT